MLQLIDRKFIVSVDEKTGNLNRLYDLVNKVTIIDNNYLKINDEIIDSKKYKIDLINYNENLIDLEMNYNGEIIKIIYQIKNHRLVKEIKANCKIEDIYECCLDNKFMLNNDKIKIVNQLTKYEIQTNDAFFSENDNQFNIINKQNLIIEFKIKRRIKFNKLSIVLLFLLLISTSLLLPQLKFIMYETYIKAIYDGEINDNYFDVQKYKGLSNGLGDIYSQYLTEEEFDQLNGTNEVIGVSLQSYNGNMVITDVVKNSSAYNNDILPGDYILKINDQQVTSYNYDVLLANKELKMIIYRPSTNETFEKTLTKQENKLQTIYSQILDVNNQKIGYIKIVEFDEDTDEEFIKQLDGMENQISGLIIDVVNNSGGDLETVYNILNRLIGEEQTILEFSNSGEVIDSKKTTKDQSFNKNIYVLQNGNSASSSEILSLVLKEYKKATIIGQTSFGKGVGQLIQPNLFGPGYIKLTNMHWQTGNKTSIHQKGIIPDIIVGETNDFTPILLTDEIDESSKGFNVLKLNNYLNYLGYNVDITNTFSQKTKQELLLFQQQNNLNITGVLDSKTAYYIYLSCNDYNKNLENNPFIKEVFKCLS